MTTESCNMHVLLMNMCLKVIYNKNVKHFTLTCASKKSTNKKKKKSIILPLVFKFQTE